jgi:hypothetical protein
MHNALFFTSVVVYVLPVMKLTFYERPPPKKRAEDVAQVVQYLPSKRKALSYNPIPPFLPQIHFNCLADSLILKKTVVKLFSNTYRMLPV